MFEKYDAYKDSGVEALGKIPNDWEVLRFRDICEFGKGLNITKENLEDVGIPCVNYGEVHSKYGFEVNPEIHQLKCVSENYLKSSPKSLLRYGDFVYADTSEDIDGSGNFTYLNSHQITFAGYHTVIVRPKNNINVRFLAYVFDSLSFRNQIRKAVKGVKVYSITKSILKDTNIWLPDFNGQYEISQFLDKKTSEIDQAIAIKEQQIALLNERKQIIIQKAVTQGLDQNVPMKDSGVEWIGQIPEHWETYFNRRLFRENSRPVKGDELPLSLSQKDGVIPSGEMKERSLSPSHRNNFKLCFPNDLVVNRFKGHLGVFFQSNYTGIVTFHYGVFEPAKNVYTKYFELLYHTEQYKTLYAGASNGMSIGLQNLSNLNFYRIKSIVPPLEEQKLICEYADKVENEHNNLIQKLETQIEKLKEYKTTLNRTGFVGESIF